MEEQKSSSQKIILLLFPPIINKFDFRSGEKERFFDLGKVKKELLLEKNITSLEKKKSLGLADIDYNSKVEEFIQHKDQTKSILVNYPRNEIQFTCLTDQLAQKGKMINNIVLLNTPNYELISSMKTEYLICPICEKIYKKEATANENGKFICPNDNDINFAVEEVKKFSEYAIEYYLKNSKGLIEKFLQKNKLSSSTITQLTVQKKEEIFSGEVQKKLLEILNNI